MSGHGPPPDAPGRLRGLLPVRLPFSARVVWLRELRGADEQALDGTDSAAAVALLERLLVARGGELDAASLCTPDRDQLLAALCTSTFGDRVDGTRDCGRCGERFDLDFRLSELASAVAASAPAPPADGVYELSPGLRFRLPTGEDELAVLGLEPEKAERVLLERCLLQGDPARDGQAVLVEMARVGPTLDLDLDASCSECGAHNPVGFSVQGWLLGRLLQEQGRLPRQIHRLARAYGWGLDEILSLPRTQRLALVALVEDESRGRPVRWQSP